jgi:ribonuclease HI
MITAYTDGACRLTNPGLCSCAWVLYDSSVPYYELSEATYLGPEMHTNNYAEYQALLKLLRYLHTNGFTNVVIHTDSTLVANQVNQKWSANNNPELKKFMVEAYGLLTVGSHRLLHVFGHGKNLSETHNKGNGRADQLCNEILDVHMEEYYADTKNIINRPTA